MDKITEELNRVFNNKYSFLRLLEVVYNRQEDLCTITFLFPFTKMEITDDERDEIGNTVKSFLSLNSNIKIKFKKSFLDNELVVSETLSYLKNEFISTSANITKNDIDSTREDFDVLVKLKLEKSIYEFFVNSSVDYKLKNYLEKVFIANFNVKLEINENIKIDTKVIHEREEQIENLAYQNIKKVERYKIGNVFLLFGEEISPNPEYIKNQKSERLSVILCGNISNFQKKSYVRKKDKPKGDDAPKYSFFTFMLDDGQGKISCTYFASKANERKMDKLSDGIKIIAIGDVKMFNERPTYYIKSVSFAGETIEQKAETELPEEAHAEDFYLCCKPMAYLTKGQENFLESAPVYNEYINNNTFVVYDFETTGLDPAENEIIEIGAVKVVAGNIVETFQTFIKPNKQIPIEITNITSITNDMVCDAPNASTVLHDFKMFCGDSIMAGYNSINFDNKFLQNTAFKCGYNFDNKQADVLLMARQKLRSHNYKLGTVVKELGIVLIDAHRALNDALATAKVLLALNRIS